MRTLITGGAGFVGSHLCEKFLGAGDEVICVDNFITGRPINIQHLRDHPQVPRYCSRRLETVARRRADR